MNDQNEAHSQSPSAPAEGIIRYGKKQWKKAKVWWKKSKSKEIAQRTSTKQPQTASSENGPQSQFPVSTSIDEKTVSLLAPIDEGYSSLPQNEASSKALKDVSGSKVQLSEGLDRIVDIDEHEGLSS
jgi:hypothetical protein